MKLSERRLVIGTLSLLFILTIVQSGAIINLFKSNSETLESKDQTAQVFGNVSLSYSHQNVYGPEDNKQSFTFTANRVANIKACAAGGGGAGGSRGFEYAYDQGFGGAGGGGGGAGECRVVQRKKFRQGDVVTWEIGFGGAGGQFGIIDVDEDGPEILADAEPANGMPGGNTQVFVNGSPLINSLVGGGGGYAGTNASSGGLGYAAEAFGGSSNSDTAQAAWHMGGYGFGSYGGNGGHGETNTNLGGGDGGSGGTAESGNQFGWNGADGYPSFGGGGGGGASGMEYNYNHNAGMGFPDDSYMSHGGYGGTGGDGYVIIYW